MKHWVGWILLLMGTIASLAAVVQRWRVEVSNRMVSLVLDGDQLLQAAADTGFSFGYLLQQMKQAGATAVALNEQTVEDLLLSGQVSWELYPKFPAPILRASSEAVVQRLHRMVAGIAPQTTFWRTVYTPSRKKLLDTLKARPGVLVYSYTDTGGAVGFSAPMSPAAFLQVRVGIDPQLARQVRGAGLTVVARPTNSLMLTPRHLQRSLATAKQAGAAMVIFSGEEVLGYRALLPHTAQAIRQQGLLYGSVEFGKQKGDERLSRLLLDRTVRVHSVSVAEMATLSPAELVDRYTRAVRERNIRVCYVRLPGSLGEEPLSAATMFLRQLRQELQASGYAVGSARPFPAPEVPPWLWLVAGGSAGTAAWLVATRMFALRRWESLAVIWFVVGAALALAGGETGRKLCALMAAMAFPVLGFVVADHLRPHRSPLWYALYTFGQMSLWSMAGGLHVAALLASLPFLVKVNQFAGVKLAHLMPLILVSWAYALGVFTASGGREVLERARHLWQRMVSLPITVGAVVAGGVALVVLVLLLMRTGNEPGIGVSGLEMKMRALLEQYLPARPRTKEFLLGHPALVAALAIAASGGARWLSVLLLLVGAIGQASIVNTLCHIHTPLSLSLPRILIGAVLGAIIGVLAFATARWAASWWRRWSDRA